VLRDHPALELRNVSDQPIYVPLWKNELPIVKISIKDFPELRSPTGYGEAWATPHLLKPGEVLRRQLSGNTFGNYLIGFGRWERGTGWVGSDPGGKTYELSAVMRWDQGELALKPTDPTKVRMWTGRLATNPVQLRLGGAAPPTSQPATQPAKQPAVREVSPHATQPGS